MHDHFYSELGAHILGNSYDCCRKTGSVLTQYDMSIKTQYSTLLRVSRYENIMVSC